MPSINFYNWLVFKKLYLDGIIFLGIQIGNIVLTSSDRLLIAHLISPEAVAGYSIGMRLISIFMTPIDAFTSPILPAFNDAIVKKDYVWIKKSLQKGFTIISIISIVCSFILYFGGNHIVSLWVGSEMQLSLEVLLAFSIYLIYFSFNTIISYSMLTPAFINYLLKIYTFSVIITIILKAAMIMNFGMPGILWASTLGMSIFYFIPSIFYLKKNEYL